MLLDTSNPMACPNFIFSRLQVLALAHTFTVERNGGGSINELPASSVRDAPTGAGLKNGWYNDLVIILTSLLRSLLETVHCGLLRCSMFFWGFPPSALISALSTALWSIIK